jgi:hypothetical protein
MSNENETLASEQTALVAPDRTEPRTYRIASRVITMELAQRFAELLCLDPTSSVEDAASDAGIKSTSVRQAIYRYRHDLCTTLVDEEICEVLYRAKTKHIKHIREAGYRSAAQKNHAGTSWCQWQLEVQAPLEHPRKQEQTIEHVGKDGGPIQTQNALRYVVSVPVEEPDE